MTRLRVAIVLMGIVGALATCARCTAQADSHSSAPSTAQSYERQTVAAFPHYVPEQQVSGVIRVSGHGSAKIPWMQAMLTSWERDFQRFQPEVKLEYRMFGTSSAIPALWAGTADIAILGEEIDPVAAMTFESVKHYPPLVVNVFTGSVDIRNIDYAQMVFVHKDNPLANVSLTELDAIFGEEHRRGTRNIRTWGELGLTGEWANKSIAPYGWRTDDSFGYYLEQYLLGGSHRWNCALHEYSHITRPDGSIYDHGQQILDALAKDRYGIAISNVRYAGPDVKALPVAVTPAGPFYAVSKQTLVDQTYPLARIIPAIVDKAPGQPLDPKVKEFLRYLLSREGQQVVLDDGRYLPLSPVAAQKELEKLK